MFPWISRRQDLTLDGKFSTVQTNISGTMPAEAAKMTNDKLVTGTHSKLDTSMPLDFKYECKENEKSPNAVPSNEMINNPLRPNESESRVVHKLPTSCSTAIVIDEMYGSIEAPAFPKIQTAYVTNTKLPDKCTKLLKTIPFNSPFSASRFTEIDDFVVFIVKCYFILEYPNVEFNSWSNYLQKSLICSFSSTFRSFAIVFNLSNSAVKWIGSTAPFW